MLDGFLISTIGGGILSLFMSIYFRLKVKKTKIRNIKKIHDILNDSKRSFRKNNYLVACKRLTYIPKYLK